MKDYEKIINQHVQKYRYSCMPSSVEMILKLLKKVPHDFYELQTQWENNKMGSFAYFHNFEKEGIRFKHEFTQSRDENFPMNDLFKKIDDELNKNKYVAVSISNGIGFHMYVICEKIKNGYIVLSKGENGTIKNSRLKQDIKVMKGTDILTYEIIQ